MGLGQFSECGLVHSCSDSENGSNIYINIKSPYTSPSHWASLLSVDWFIPALTQKMDQHLHQHQITIHITIPSSLLTTICECQQSLPEWERGVSSSVCLPVPWVCLLCQHARWARSVPACQRVIQMFIQMSWKPRHCATVPDGSSSFTRLYSWFGLFAWNDDIWLFYSFMWQPIGCVCHHLLF